MKNIFFLFGFMFLHISLSSQNSIISMPPNYLQYNGFNDYETYPLPQPNISGLDDYYQYHGQSATHCHNAMQDVDGNLLFFIVDDMVYDKDGYLIDQIHGWQFWEAVENISYEVNVKGTSEILIVPKPSKCNQWLIVAIGKAYVETTIPTGTLWKATLDLSPPNVNALQEPLVFSDRNGILTDPDLTGYTAFNAQNSLWNWNLQGSNGFLATTKLRIDNTRLIFVTRGGDFVTGLMDENGVSSFGTGATLGPVLSGEMELYEYDNGNYRIAYPRIIDGSHLIYTAIANSDGELILNTEMTIELGNVQPHGLEFSEDGNIIYFSHEVNIEYPNAIEYFNFSTEVRSSLNIPNDLNYAIGQIELGFDQKMYFGNGQNLSYLANSNLPLVSNWVLGPPINYDPSFIELVGPGITTYILPDQIDGENYSTVAASNGEICCAEEFVYTAESYTAASDDWNGINNTLNPGSNEIYIETELRVPAGTNLDIYNMTLRFAPEAKLIIEPRNGNTPSGRLRIWNTTLTSIEDCGDRLWQGVEVLGHTDMSQYNSNQGRFEMRDNSVIENAYKGVSLLKIIPMMHLTHPGTTMAG